MVRFVAPRIGSAPKLMSEVAYIAALNREVAPLIRDWRRTRRAYTGRNFEFFENGDTVLVCGGIGPEPARRAAEAVIALYRPSELVSIGFVGALDSSMLVGHVFQPALIVDARDSSRTPASSGSGVLVSFASVAGAAQKEKLARAYNAQAVDMEAASIAQAAQAHGLRFRAVKVVSDELDFVMPPMERFVASDGSFRTPAFAVFAALRPTLWPAVIRLARNSARASRSLSDHLRTAMNQTSRETPAMARKQ
jgi:adenosylhomocysteine nucleosidase